MKLNEFAHPPTDTLAIILAGGRGTRLSTLTRCCAKPSIPFGGDSRIIDFPLSNCVNSGMRQIGVLTQYESHDLIHHLQSNWGFFQANLGEFIDAWPAHQNGDDHWYRGTADALHQNLSTIKQLAPKRVLVLAGDHVYKMDYRPMIRAHLETGAGLTVGSTEVPRAEATQFGVMRTDDGERITEFNEKPSNPAASQRNPTHASVSMGIYLFDTDYLIQALERDAVQPNSSHDFGRDIIPQSIWDRRAYAYRFVDKWGQPRYWRDIGTLDSYYHANMDLLGSQADSLLLDQQWPILTRCTQAAPAKFIRVDGKLNGLALDSFVSPGCTVSGAWIERSVLYPNVRVDAFSSVMDSVVLPGARIGRNCRIQRAIVMGECRIADDFCLEDGGGNETLSLEVTESGITLIAPRDKSFKPVATENTPPAAVCELPRIANAV